jgi:urease accessory protein
MVPVAEPVAMLPESLRRIEPGDPRRLELRFDVNGGVTRMNVFRQEPPWRAIRAFHNPQRQALVHLHNVSGGILAGDALDLSVQAGPATRVQVTTVGATRIYRTRPDRAAARLSTSIRIGEGAMLEYLPDATIPFAGSRFMQRTSVSLGANAGFIGWEIVAAGRVGSGEVFEFDFFDSEFHILSDARPLAMERYSLRPSVRDPRSVVRWGRFRYTATLYVCHTGVAPSRWIGVESRLNELAVQQTSQEVRWGASTLVAGGVVIRGLSLEVHQITTGLPIFWGHAKQEIWGEPAVVPRKIY